MGETHFSVDIATRALLIEPSLLSRYNKNQTIDKEWIQQKKNHVENGFFPLAGK